MTGRRWRLRFPSTPLGQLAGDWLDDRLDAAESSEATIYRQGMYLAGLIRVHGDRPVAALDEATMRAWEAEHRGQAANTRRAYRHQAARFCRWLVTEGYLVEDPSVSLTPVPRSERASDRPRVQRPAAAAEKTAAREAPAERLSGEVGVLASRWIDGRRRRGELTERSADVLLSRLKSLDQVHGDRPIRSLDPATLLRWQETIGHMAAPTRRAYLSTLRQFCGWLVLDGHLRSDPSLNLAKIREPRRVPRALTHAEARKVLNACPDLRSRAVVLLMLQCGLRCVEVSRLDVTDWDPEARTVQVRGKADHERVLPVPAAAAAAISEYRAALVWPRVPLFQAAAGGDGRCLDGRLTAGAVSGMVGQVMTAAGVHTSRSDGRTAHALRHTAASDVLDRSRDLVAVKQMLGHQSLQSTEIYLRRADLGRLRDAMDGRDYETVPA